MAMHRYRITPRSGFATPLRSDTLYGHLLWAAAMREGKAYVAEMIDAFAAGAPPFVLSSAFPAGQLPMPPLPGIKRENFKEQFAGKGNFFEQLQRYKTFRKNGYWPLQLWQTLQGKISQEALFSAWMVEAAVQDRPKRKRIVAESVATVYRPHVSIDRLNGCVLNQGGLFFTKGLWYRPGMELDLYVNTDDVDTFEILFRQLEEVGYGADCSSGMGQFSFYRDNEFDPLNFDIPGTHRLSLSVCTASDLSEFKGYWIPMVKHGRAWSGFGETNPFKKPFFAFAEGSLFRKMPHQGYLLRNIHSDSKIVQIGWPLTIPVTLEG